MALVIEDVATTVNVANQTAQPITMPTGIVAGDLLLCLYTQDGNDTSVYPADWVELVSGGSGGAVTMKNGFKIADGSDTLEIEAGNNQQSSAVVYRISGWEQDEGVGVAVQQTITNGSGDTSPNPPSMLPNDGEKEYLFIAIGGCDRRTFDTTTPTDYGTLQRAQSTGANGSSTATAVRLLTTSVAQDPSAFGIASNDEWMAATIVCHPAGSVAVTRDPGVGALVFAGQAPVASENIFRRPGVGALVWGGDATVALVEVNAFPGSGALVFGGLAPTRLTAEREFPGAGALVFTGELAAVLVSVAIPVPVGALVFVGETPSRDITKLVPIPVGALVFAGLAPTADVAVIRAIPVGTLTFTGELELLLVPVILEMGVRALLMVNPAPTMDTAINMPVDDTPC
jgi:hypothetical protein